MQLMILHQHFQLQCQSLLKAVFQKSNLFIQSNGQKHVKQLQYIQLIIESKINSYY